jgi:hypothetical protein
MSLFQPFPKPTLSGGIGLPTVTTTAQHPMSLFQPFPKPTLSGGIGDPSSLSAMGGQPLVGVGAPVGVDMPAPRSSILDRLGRGMNWAEKHPITSQGIIKGISSALPNQETNALNEKNRLTQRQLDLEERQYNEEQERRKRIAQLLLPMYQQMAPKMFGQTTP